MIEEVVVVVQQRRSLNVIVLLLRHWKDDVRDFLVWMTGDGGIVGGCSAKEWARSGEDEFESRECALKLSKRILFNYLVNLLVWNFVYLALSVLG